MSLRILAMSVLAACTGQISSAPDDAGGTADTDAAALDAAVAPKPTPTCDNVDQRLHDDFGIVITPGTLPFEGLPSENIGCAQRIIVYQMFIRAFSWEGYVQHLDPSDPFTLQLYHTANPASGSCSAYTPNAHNIQIRDLHTCLNSVSGTSDADFARVATFLNHESGHVIGDRHPALKTDFGNAGLTALDPQCYDHGFIKTYSLRTTNPVSESFAESLALFLWHKKVGTLGTITNFEAECPHTYDWMHTHLFGNQL